MSSEPSPAGGLSGRPTVVLGFGIVCVSSAAILIKLAEPTAAPLAIATWRMLFSSLLLLPAVALTRRRDVSALDARDWRTLGWSGLALALHFGLWISSLALTSVASSVVLVTTSPLWVALAEPLLFRQHYRPQLLAGVAVAVVGGVTITAGDRTASPNALAGDLLAVGGALAAAAYFLAGRQLRARVGLLVYIGLVYGVAAAALLVTSAARGIALHPFPAQTWLLLILLALVPQVLGHSSFNWALGHLSASYVSATVLGEALGSTLLAWWVLGQEPPPTTWAGGALILAGLWLAGRAERVASRTASG